MLPRIDAREYKLLLNPAFFRDAMDTGIANAFLRDQLATIVRTRSDAPLRRDFERKHRRGIRFYDTEGCVLDRARYALRTRDAGGDPEVTLKLRTSDLFVMASMRLRGRDDDADSKFEEDISPLEVTVPGSRALAVADPPSMRSRFSQSTSQATGRRLDRLGDAFALYPGLRANLAEAGAAFDADDRLFEGPEIVETVFDGPRVTLDEEVETELGLTWWEFAQGAPVARVAELSYKVETRDGALSRDAARRGSRLFVGLQADLPHGCIDLAHPSKTALALPDRCRPAA